MSTTLQRLVEERGQDGVYVLEDNPKYIFHHIFSQIEDEQPDNIIHFELSSKDVDFDVMDVYKKLTENEYVELFNINCIETTEQRKLFVEILTNNKDLLVVKDLLGQEQIQRLIQLLMK